MSRWLADMTWPQVAQAVAAGCTTLILPLGATEQHGHHLPIGTDTLRAVALAERLAARLDGALIAPPLPAGCSDEHSGFAGLLGLDHETLARVILEYGRRMVPWGVRRLVLLSAHGGNGQALRLATRWLAQELPTLQVWPPALHEPEEDHTPMEQSTIYAAMLRIAHQEGIAPEAAGLHAGEWETSEILHLCPDLVDRQRATPGAVAPSHALLPRLRAAGVQALAPSGTIGDPTRATAERGGRYLDAAADALTAAIAAALEQP